MVSPMVIVRMGGAYLVGKDRESEYQLLFFQNLLLPI